jgi:hypothetical protein
MSPIAGIVFERFSAVSSTLLSAVDTFLSSASVATLGLTLCVKKLRIMLLRFGVATIWCVDLMLLRFGCVVEL